MSFFFFFFFLTTRGLGNEHGTNKPPPTGRVQQRSKGDATCWTISQNPSCWHPSWLNKACTTRKDSESGWLAKNNLETNPIPIKPETAGLFSWVPLPSCSPPGCPFPVKSLALSAHMSPRTIHFWVLDKSPVSGPGRDPPSRNSLTLSRKWHLHGTSGTVGCLVCFPRLFRALCQSWVTPVSGLLVIQHHKSVQKREIKNKENYLLGVIWQSRSEKLSFLGSIVHTCVCGFPNSYENLNSILKDIVKLWI